MEKFKSVVAEQIKFEKASTDIKYDILVKFGIVSDALYGTAGASLIERDSESYKGILAKNVIKWAYKEKGGKEFEKAGRAYTKINKLFSSIESLNSDMGKVALLLHTTVKEFNKYDEVLGRLDLFGVEGDFDSILDGVPEDIEETSDVVKDYFDDRDDYIDVSDEEQGGGYDEGKHKDYYTSLKNNLMQTLKSLYGNHADGLEIVDGIIIPGGFKSSDGVHVENAGILSLNTSKTEVKQSIVAAAIYEEFIKACNDCGINVGRDISTNPNTISPYKYNPFLCRLIASGDIDREKFEKGWDSYSTSLGKMLDENLKRLAVIKADTGKDDIINDELSPYSIALIVVNNRDGLGMQVRVACGDAKKTITVIDKLIKRLDEREKTNKSIAFGKAKFKAGSIEQGDGSGTISVYTDIEGYQAIPQFMGELLCNVKEGFFKSDLNQIMIGTDLNNNIVFAPNNSWVLPIIATTRSGKGVLTLNILLSVLGAGSPLFYLDCKPDMAATLWEMQKRFNIKNSIIIDGKSFEGKTTIEESEYKAPYADIALKSLRSKNSHELLERSQGLLIYLKTMQIIYLAMDYYNVEMARKYGKMFVVFDEFFAAIATELGALVDNIELYDSARKSKGKKDADISSTKLLRWVTDLMQKYKKASVSTFGGGLRSVVLSQHAQDSQYTIKNFTEGKLFVTDFILKKAEKIFGKQEGGQGTYGVYRSPGDADIFKFYNDFRYFGIGTQTDNTFANLKTFKPLLVLNKNDSKEMTGEGKDGAFTSTLIKNIQNHTDSKAFREKYFDPTNPRLSNSIGFEGALGEVARIVGKSPYDLLNDSLSRGYEIADKTLRYYNVIGSGGIQNVYDYICSTDINHLWDTSEIELHKNKGTTLPYGGSYEVEKSIDGEKKSAFTNPINLKEDFKVQSKSNGIKANEVIEDKNKSKPLNIVTELNTEERNILNNIKNKEQDEYRYSDNQFEEGGKNQTQKENTDLFDEELGGGGYVFSQGKGGLNINPGLYKDTTQLNKDNAIIANFRDISLLSRIEKRVKNSLRGTGYLLGKKWDSILNSIEYGIDSNLVTRVLLVSDEMYVNGRMVCLKNFVGGYDNLRLEDIVNFKTLLKRFRNVSELTIDSVMFERLGIEITNIPNGIFELSRKLLKISIILESGKKEVLERGKSVTAIDKGAKRAEYNNRFDAACAFSDTNMLVGDKVYQNKLWKSTKSFGGKGWESIQRQITKEKPSLGMAAATGLFVGPIFLAGSILSGGMYITSKIKRRLRR